MGLDIDGFSGALVRPSDRTYDEVRALWNGALDRRPALIARCRSPRDVAAVIRHAKYERLVALKDRYDPTNFFRFNQNIRPSKG